MLIIKIETPIELKGFLYQGLKTIESTELEFDKVSRTRNDLVDTTVIVAIVAGISTIIGALIPGLISIIQSKKENERLDIYIKGKDGWEMKIPKNISIEDIEKIERLKDILSDKTISGIEIKNAANIAPSGNSLF